MRHLLWSAVALAVVAAGPAAAGEITSKPIDTDKLVVKPTKAAADLSSATIKMVGNTTAGAVAQNGYVKTINNLFGIRKSTPSTVQPGRSALPTPAMFSSMQYKNFNTPVLPSSTPIKR